MEKKVAADEAIAFYGRLTVQTAREHKEKLAAAYRRGGELRLSIRDVEAVDLSFFQLLCSLHRTAMRDRRRVTLERPVSPLLRDLLGAVGFERNIACREEGDETCIWKAVAADEPQER